MTNNIKYLEVSDFHYSPKWGDISMSCARAVREAAINKKVDFIAVPGDLYDAPIMVTDKGGMNQLRKIIRMWLDVCPVVAIEGTPSHDGPGCYGPLEDMGVTVLRPGKTYGYDGNGITEANSSSLAILFGIPELNKNTIQAQLKLSADEANAEAVKLLSDYVLQYIAPMREKYKDIPAFALLHGNISDAHKENNPDIIMRSSDIVIHTEDLLPANIDRWSLGHIHTPWESKIINGGYPGFPGMDSNPWGKRDFIPAMNLITDGKVERLPYGTPMRKKIIDVAMATNPDVAYWLVSDNPNAMLPASVHPWSRITFDEVRNETRRVTKEQAKDVKKLSDLYKLIDPTVTVPVLDLVDTIPEGHASSQDAVDLRMSYLQVKGCTFFRTKTVTFDLAKLADGVTSLMGDNGSGKSSVLSFCTPYPLVVGKDTSSGRISAIKDFFASKDSSIEKHFIVNGQKHEHLITIRGAHTQSPKVECYLTVDGVPQLDCATFDEMMGECERLYGSFADYLPTTFYVQPLQSKTGSSLMSASMTDIRNLVQNIAGIDRDKEKRFALDSYAKADSEVKRLESWITGAQSMLDDPQEIERNIASLTESKPVIEHRRAQAELDGKLLGTQLEALQKAKAESDEQARAQESDRTRMWELTSNIEQNEKRILAIKETVQNLPAIKEKLAKNEQAVATVKDIEAKQYAKKQAQWEYDEKIRDLQSEISKATMKWNADCDLVVQGNKKAQQDFESEQAGIIRSIEDNERSITDYQGRIKNLNIPCPQCGYLADDITAQIEKLESSIVMFSDALAIDKASLKALVHPIAKQAPEKSQALIDLEATVIARPAILDTPLPTKPALLSTFEVNMLHDELAESKNAGEQIAVLESKIEQASDHIAVLKAKTYRIDGSLGEKLMQVSGAISAKRKEWAEHNAELATIDARIASMQERIIGLRTQQQAILKAEADAQMSAVLAERWKYISAMLQPSKIPALELELLLDSIDAEATRIIEPYQGARFAISTETQSEGKAGSVDRFDIMVYDSESGDSRSFMKFSPGQKAFFSDAYVKALVRQRNERSNRSYAPIIMDESDGPIQPELISEYYEMQRRYWTDTPVLVVSHSPASHEHIEHTITVDELLKETL